MIEISCVPHGGTVQELHDLLVGELLEQHRVEQLVVKRKILQSLDPLFLSLPELLGGVFEFSG